MAYDETTGSAAPKRVTDLIRPEPKPLYELIARNTDGEKAEFLVTDDHPWKIEGSGWVETAHLKAAQRIETAKGETLLIESMPLTKRIESTYNLTVEGWHTFLVDDDSAIVHHACDPNKLRHIFGKAEHKLDGVVKNYGSEEETFQATAGATDDAVKGMTDGLFKESVGVAGESVTVTGKVVNGVARIGTAYVP